MFPVCVLYAYMRRMGVSMYMDAEAKKDAGDFLLQFENLKPDV